MFAGETKDRQPFQGVRAWVAACATGEEVYSIAICLMEIFGDGVQIFGTDINDGSLEYARAGIYPSSIANDVSPERLLSFFNRVDRGYQVNKTIRECCVFARHDLTKDPPFSRLDLVSCRNVLIYMGPVLQKRIIPMFHYSLKPGGILMLGSAEALAGNSDLFELLDKQNKLFRREAALARFTPNFDTRQSPNEALAQTTASGDELEVLTQRAIRDRFAIDGVVINRDLQIVLFRGHTGFYLEPAPGNPSFHLLRMIRDDLAFKLESIVSRAMHHNEVVRESDIHSVRDGRAYKVSLEVMPLQQSAGGETHYLVTFESQPDDTNTEVSTAKGTRADDAKFLEYEREMTEARAHLRAMAEEHEVNVEELRAANEEVRSTNEELQSTNEELSTAKEELQSTNEELTTVNEELSTKNVPLGQTQRRLEKSLQRGQPSHRDGG